MYKRLNPYNVMQWNELKELNITVDPLIRNNQEGIVHTEFESVAVMLQRKMNAVRLDSIPVRFIKGNEPTTIYKMKVSNLGVAFILMRSMFPKELY